MKTKQIFILLCAFLALGNAYADEASHKAAVEKLLDVTETKNLLNSAYAQVEQAFLQSANSVTPLEENDRPIIEKHLKKLSAIMKEEMSWDKLKVPFTDLYMRVYTEAEVKEIIVFYESPTGKKMLAKMPDVMRESMTMTQEMMRSMLPKLQAEQEALIAELQKSKAAAAEKEAKKAEKEAKKKK
ncbi:MAG: DUF2059 domain-containing protein [Gammaproteobacteria bacterium]|nr:DUF2059 domain-containing protein [Gammaproteobacteria bacterium]